MLENLSWLNFSDLNLSDPFFNSLKADYIGFDEWFSKKAKTGEKALVFIGEDGIHAFLYIKDECEQIKTVTKILPAIRRIKIGTLKLDETIRGQRLGEGIIGVALWKWQESRAEEIYVTVFEKQNRLIGLLQKFGFINIGIKDNGEYIFSRTRSHVDYSNAYFSFPFVSPHTFAAGIIPVNDYFHDRLFPYSESNYKFGEIEEVTAGNGLTKVYIGSPYTATHYSEGEIVGIYRIYTGEGAKGNKSAITSFCIITKITIVKRNGSILIPINEYLAEAGNKTVFTEQELRDIYKNFNVVMIEMTYNGYFEKGRNITYWQLKNKGLFETHPYKINYSLDQMKEILMIGGRDVKNIIID